MVMDRKAVSRDYSSLTEEGRKTRIQQIEDKLIEIAVHEALRGCDTPPTEEELKIRDAWKVAGAIEEGFSRAIFDIAIATMGTDCKGE